MLKNERISAVIESIMLLSPSFAASPHAVSPICITEQMRKSGKDLLKNYTDVLLISLRKEYTHQDVAEFVGLSKECLEIREQRDRQLFVEQRLTAVLEDHNNLERWKEQQCSLSLGIMIGACQKQGFAPEVIYKDELDANIGTILGKLIGNELDLRYIVLL